MIPFLNSVLFHFINTYFFCYSLLNTTLIYYSKFAKDHAMFVMEQSWDGRLIGSMRCRCQAVIAAHGSHTSYWQLLLLVIELFGTFLWLKVTFLNLHFWGLLLWRQNACYLLFTFGIQQWHSGNKHVLEYMPFLVCVCATHAKKYNTALNIDP